MSDPKTNAQAIGDVFARASWLYECTHIPNANPIPAVGCLELTLGQGYDPAIAKTVVTMWNRCPNTMTSRERFRTLLEVCFEQGWHSNEGLAS